MTYRRIRIGFARDTRMAGESGAYSVAGQSADVGRFKPPLAANTGYYSVVGYAAADQNTAPYWLESAPSTLGPFVFGTEYAVDLSAYATDPNGDELSFARTGSVADTAPSSVTVNATTGELTIPSDLPIGSYSIQVDVSNPAQSSSEANFIVFSEETNAVRRDYFNYAGQLQWENGGGDWIDANGTSHGSVPFTQAAVSTGGTWTTVDVLPFMAEWLAAPVSLGLLVRATPFNGSSASFCSRQHPTPSRVPYLLVTTNLGDFVCPCVADSGIPQPSSTFTGGNGQDDTFNLSDGRCALIRFDVSGVEGTPTAATMYLNTSSRFTSSAVLHTYKIKIPRVYDYNTIATRGGIADEVATFADLASHPDVLISMDLLGPNWASQFYNLEQSKDTIPGVPIEDRPEIGFEQITADNGLGWIRFRMPIDYTASGAGNGNGFSAVLNFVPVPQVAGTAPVGPTTTAPMGPTELWFQYGIMVEDDWAGTTDSWHTGGKIPGMTGRYGYHQYSNANNAYYWDTWVENQSPGLGRWLFPGDGYGNYSVWAGWAARMGWENRVFGSVDNPMRFTTPITTYCYWPLKPQSGSGDVEAYLRAQLRPGRQHTIEQHIKMNTVDQTVLDAGGNGVGNPDGELDVWLDGRLVYSRQDIVWRHHIGIAIQDAWVTFYNGGSEQGYEEHHARLGPIIVARRYIGPRFSSEY